MQDYYSGNDFFPVVSAFRKLKRATKYSLKELSLAFWVILSKYINLKITA